MKKTIKVWDTLKFAQKGVRLYGIAAAVLFIITLIITSIFVLCDLNIIHSSTLMGLSMLGMFWSAIFCLGAFLFFLDGKIYLWDLKRKGFAIPQSKKECNFRLSMLMYEETDIKEGKIHKRTLVLAIVSFVITIIAAIHSFTLAKWPHPVAIIVMLIVSVVVLLQAFNRLFKNDIDIDIEDSRWVRQRIVPAAVGVGIWFFVVFMGVQMINVFPMGNEHYYEQIVRYNKKEDAESYRYYMDSLPSYAQDVRFISWGKACGISFYVPQENVKDMQAYFESIEEPCVIHTIEEGEEEFTQLCGKVKDSTTYFRSEDFENCVVYEYTEWYEDQWGHKSSWYAIIDTNSGEVGYGYCPTDW